ncbi:hypothetical protein OEZ85_013469 [Tetradesmus obliquus]|uniref:Uncharacterized protein n=1 Tax=Tetradesmus obliquus TaxID=3088 RepID=A0ABY8URC8_TETOB|nr:hypothetical protein OEZ85_013469 [Tetradesmus obliquus]
MKIWILCGLLWLAGGAGAVRKLSSSSATQYSAAVSAPAAGKGQVLSQPQKAKQAVLGEVADAAAAGEAPHWHNTKPSDACMPFDVSRYGHKSVDQFCAKLNSLSDAQLKELHANAPLPSSNGGFPLRGCSHRCIAGSSFAAIVAKDPDNNLGWGGKCFKWTLNPTTGVPTQLINIFSPQYDNASLPDSERVKGVQQAHARVYYVEHSRGDNKPAWRFDHGGAEDIFDPVRKSMLIVQGFNDEMREVRPGFLLGRIFISHAPDGALEMPIFFALLQACTADGHFPTTPEARALPPLGGG